MEVSGGKLLGDGRPFTGGRGALLKAGSTQYDPTVPRPELRGSGGGFRFLAELGTLCRRSGGGGSSGLHGARSATGFRLGIQKARVERPLGEVGVAGVELLRRLRRGVAAEGAVITLRNGDAGIGGMSAILDVADAVSVVPMGHCCGGGGGGSRGSGGGRGILVDSGALNSW